MRIAVSPQIVIAMLPLLDLSLNIDNTPQSACKDGRKHDRNLLKYEIIKTVVQCANLKFLNKIYTQ